MLEFDEWINGMKLLDLPNIGRKFTWRKAKSSSKLDQVLVDPDWLVKIDAWKLKGTNSSISDHILLVLEDRIIDYGPKLFQCFDTQFSYPNFYNSCKMNGENMET